MLLKKSILSLFILVCVNVSWAQNFYSITGNTASYEPTNSRDNIHELPNGNIVKVLPVENVTPNNGNLHDGILIMVLNTAGNVLFSERVFYDDINSGSGFVDLRFQNSCIDNDGNLYVATLFSTTPAPTIFNVGNILNRNTAVLKFDFNSGGNSYSYNNWITQSLHWAYGANQYTRYPRGSRVAYIASMDKIFHVVSVSSPFLNGVATIDDDCQHLVVNLYDPVTGNTSFAQQQNVIALNDRIGPYLFQLMEIGEMKGHLFIAGNEKVYYDPVYPNQNNWMPAVIQISAANLDVMGRSAIRGNPNFMSGIGAASSIKWLDAPSQQVFIMGYHGYNAHIGLTVMDINLNPVLSKEVIMPNFFETYPYDIDYDYLNDRVEISCQSDNGLGRLSLDANASYSDLNYWSAETSLLPDGTLMLGSNWFATGLDGQYMEVLRDYNYCYVGQNEPRQVQYNTPSKYVFNLSESHNQNGTGGSHRVVHNPNWIPSDIGLTPLTGEWFTCSNGSGNLISAQNYKTNSNSVSFGEDPEEVNVISKVEVYDLSGKLLFTENEFTNIQNLKLQVNTKYSSTGIYMVVKYFESGEVAKEKLFFN